MGKRIAIEPLSRVEGHGRIQIYMEGDRVRQVELSLTEPPRLFEALVLGKPWDEVADITCRICSICSSVHKVVGNMAVERAMGIDVPPAAKLWRELLVNGGQIESHALHLFALVLPDLKGVGGLPELAQLEPETVKMGLRIKAAGNFIQEGVGGRIIHPPNVIPGGIASAPGADVLIAMKGKLEAVLPEALSALTIFAEPTLPAGNLPHHSPLAIKSPPAAPLFGEEIEMAGGAIFAVPEWRDHIAEQVCPDSHAKISTVHGETVVVGALPRLALGEPLSSKAAQAFFDHRDRLNHADMTANSLAQGIELVNAIEHGIEIIDQLLLQSNEPTRTSILSIRQGIGSACIEAPRGLLIHSYSFDNHGLCTAAEIITPTVFNQRALREDLTVAATTLEGMSEDAIVATLQKLVRCYDPCISCAVHVLRA